MTPQDRAALVAARDILGDFDLPLSRRVDAAYDVIHAALSAPSSAPVPIPIPQEDLPADAAKILRDNLWNLYDGTTTGEASSAPVQAAPDVRAGEPARWRAALQSIASNTCCRPCQEAALVARHALIPIGHADATERGSLGELSRSGQPVGEPEPSEAPSWLNCACGHVRWHRVGLRMFCECGAPKGSAPVELPTTPQPSEALRFAGMPVRLYPAIPPTRIGLEGATECVFVDVQPTPQPSAPRPTHTANGDEIIGWTAPQPSYPIVRAKMRPIQDVEAEQPSAPACTRCGGDRGNAGGAACEHCRGTGVEPSAPAARTKTPERLCADCGAALADPCFTVCEPCWDRAYLPKELKP